MLEMTRALLRLEAGQPSTFRILYLGDSHVVSGPEPALVASALKSVFGDGGPGLAMPWTLPPHRVRDGLTTGCSAGWTLHQPRAGEPPTAADPSGCFMEAREPGAAAWVEGEGTSFRLLFLRQPGAGSLELEVDGAAVAREDLAAPEPALGVLAHAIATAGPHRYVVRTTRRGPVRLLGACLEKPGGVTLSPLGVLGARASLLLASDDLTFAGVLRELGPDLVVLAFGTNEAGEEGFDGRSYTSVLVRVIERIRQASPQAAVLLVGPPDRAVPSRQGWRTPAGLPMVVASQQEACRVTGARFLDRLAAMGGEGTVDIWAGATPPLARPDRTHFTVEGYTHLASLVVAFTLNEYNALKGSPVLARRVASSEREASALLALAHRPVPVPGPSLGGVATRPPTRAAGVAPRRLRVDPSGSVCAVRGQAGGITITNVPQSSRSSGEPPRPRIQASGAQLDGLRSRAVRGGGEP